MQHYTAYTRSGVAVVISGILYAFIGLIIIGLLLDELPEYEDLLIVTMLFVLPPVSYCLAMLTSKSKLSILIKDDRVVIHVARGSAATFYINTIQFNQIRFIQLKNSIAAGSYILLELEYGLRIKLYSKQFAFKRNNTFYEMFIALKKATESKSVLQPESIVVSIPTETKAEEVVTTIDVIPEDVPAPSDVVSLTANVASADKNNSVTQQLSSIVYFKGSQFGSAVGIVIWAVFILLSMGPIIAGADSIVVTNWPIVLLIIWVLPMSLLLNYLGLSQEYIEVKKHNLPWLKKRIYLKGIKEVEFHSPMQYANAITIVLKDFRYETYQCPTIKPEQWQDLKNTLERLGINVRVKSNFRESNNPSKKKAQRRTKIVLVVYALLVIGFGGVLSIVDENSMVHQLLWILFWLLLIASIIVLAFLIPWLYRKQKEGEGQAANKR